MMTQFQTLIEMYFVGNYTYGGVYTVNNTDAHGIRLKKTLKLISFGAACRNVNWHNVPFTINIL